MAFTLPVTIAQLRAYAPQFTTDVASDEIVQMMIDEATARTSADAWGVKAPIAIRYFALHLLQLWINAQPVLDPDTGLPTASVNVGALGNPTWLQVGTLQVRFPGPGATVGSNFIKPYTDSWWESTVYGQAYASMIPEVVPERVVDGYYEYRGILGTGPGWPFEDWDGEY